MQLSIKKHHFTLIPCPGPRLHITASRGSGMWRCIVPRAAGGASPENTVHQMKWALGIFANTIAATSRKHPAVSPNGCRLVGSGPDRWLRSGLGTCEYSVYLG